MTAGCYNFSYVFIYHQFFLYSLPLSFHKQAVTHDVTQHAPCAIPSDNNFAGDQKREESSNFLAAHTLICYTCDRELIVYKHSLGHFWTWYKITVWGISTISLEWILQVFVFSHAAPQEHAEMSVWKQLPYSDIYRRHPAATGYFQYFLAFQGPALRHTRFWHTYLAKSDWCVRLFWWTESAAVCFAVFERFIHYCEKAQP